MQPKADCLHEFNLRSFTKEQRWIFLLSGHTPQSPAAAVEQKCVFASISWRFVGSPSSSLNKRYGAAHGFADTICQHCGGKL
jgi:hypothetical protein